VKAKDDLEERNVPRNPLMKFLDRRKPETLDPRSPLGQALSRLAQLAEQHPELASLADLQAALLKVTFSSAPPIPTVTLDPEHAASKFQAGVPLLRGEPITLDANWLRKQYGALCDAVIAQQAADGARSNLSQTAAQMLKNAVTQGTLDVQSLTLDVLAGDPNNVSQRAAQLDLDAGLAATLLRWTLLPILEQLAHVLHPLRNNVAWQRGYCLTCGAWPIFAEQRGIEQNRFLRCGLCASEWQSVRVECPFCGSRTPGDIAYLHEETGLGTQRAVTCERCHCYYKVVTALVPTPTPQLAVVDLATLHLDLIALDRAYAPPA